MKRHSLARTLTIVVLSSRMLPGSALAASPDRAGTQPDGKASRKAAQSACRDEFRRMCRGVRPGGSEVVACLQQHEADLSPSCRRALEDARGVASHRRFGEGTQGK